MLRDIRHAVRALRTWRRGALLAVLTLAAGIGTMSALSALLRAALSDASVAIEDGDRLVRLYAMNPAAGIRRSPVATADFDVLSSARSFDAIAAHYDVEMAAGTPADEDVVKVMLVSPHFFDVLHGRAAEGRLFTAPDFAGNPTTAVVSEATWRRRFAGRRIVDAPSLRLNGREQTVVGVLPASFSYSMIGVAADVWVPLPQRGIADARLMVISRLAPGVTWSSARRELATLAAPNQPEAGWRWGGIPVQEDLRARTAGAAAWIFLPGAVVLIIGCVNVACMLLARGIHRETELAVRMALGADRRAIFRQLLVENVLLGAAAGIIGTALGSAGLDLIVRVLIETKPEVGALLSGDRGLAPIALMSSVAACLSFGVVPAFRLSRRDIASILKGSAPAGRVRVAGYTAGDLVVFVELTLASVLIVMTAMSFAVFSALQQAQPGFAMNELLDAPVPSGDAFAAAERVRDIGGVTRVSLATAGPGGGAAALVSTPGGATAAASIVETDVGFFETTGLTIVQGRQFLPDETAGAAVTIVSETVASTLWPAENPLGRPLDVAVKGRLARLVVIGVARDAMRVALPRAGPGAVYRPLDRGAHREIRLLVRSTGATEIARRVSGVLRRGTDGTPVRVRVYADVAREIAGGVRILRLFGVLALIALVLAGTGIFAVVSQSVARRTPEFGVRLALGATRWRVLRTVLARELKLIAGALAAGTLGTVAVTRSSGLDDAAMIVAVSVNRPGWGLALIALSGTVAVAACVLATYRIVKLDPSAVLRRL